MHIAFTSCASTRLVPNQPIWDHIRASAPRHVVLLGDNFYNDVPDVGMTTLKEMTTHEFVVHMLARYRQQLEEPHFRQLVEAPGITLHAIWDDHDFAWNNAAGGQLLADPQQAEKVRVSTNVMRAFRRALAAKDINTFPSAPNAAELWVDFDNPHFQPLEVSSIPLEDTGRSWLHLTDGRTFRKKPELLGTAQRTQLGVAFAAHPDALHIIASGVTFGKGEGLFPYDGWQQYPADSDWLLDTMGSRGWLMLSGDIHKNQLKTYKPLGVNGMLVDATASGAAIHAYLNGLIKGPEVRNHGLLNLQPDYLEIEWRSFNQIDQRIPDQPRRYPRTAGGSLVVR